jgi:hypothetical protein
VLSFDELELPTDGWTPIEPAGGTLRWRNDRGDQFSADFFPIAPDLPAPVAEIGPLRAFYRKMLGDAGGLVEVDAIALAGNAAMRAIFKIPQDPTGMTYLGAVTIPFRDCSFVLKWQCPELGMTGVRDSAVFAAVSPKLDENGAPIGWAADPYLPSHRARCLRNRADDEEWDKRFPKHPLSRLRGYLLTLGSLRFSERVAREAPFVGPRG